MKDTKASAQLIKSFYSQNRRWGVEIVGDPVAWEANRLWGGHFGSDEGVRGAVLSLGKVGRTEIFRYVSPEEDPQANNLFVVLGRDLEAVEGCKLMTNLGLQGGDRISVLVARECAVWCECGHLPIEKRFRSLSGGQVIDTPTGVLVAAGIVEAEGGEKTLPEVSEISPEVARAWNGV